MPVKILCIGDVVGKPGRRMLSDHLPEIVRDHGIDLVVCNAENIAGGSGLTPQLFAKLLHYGVDVVTLGDHVYRKRDIILTLETSDQIVRPANLAARAAGKRWTVVPTKDGRRQVAVVCLLGQMFMGNWNSPWEAIDRVMDEIPKDVRIRVVDMHAEASSEKIAMGWYLDGRASVVFGTHTHIPTADARVLEKGLACISDVGMTGPYDSVLGRRKDRVLQHLTTNMPFPFDVATGDPRLYAAVATVDPETGKASSIEPITVCGLKSTEDGDDGPD